MNKLFIYIFVLLFTSIYCFHLRNNTKLLKGIQKYSHKYTSESLVMSTNEQMKVFRMKHPGTCSGMFWRADPRGNAVQKALGSLGKPDWPRNGALLKGITFEVPSKPEGSLKWLEVVEFKQNGSNEWVSTPNCFMQFEQNGTLLFEE